MQILIDCVVNEHTDSRWSAHNSARIVTGYAPCTYDSSICSNGLLFVLEIWRE